APSEAVAPDQPPSAREDVDLPGSRDEELAAAREVVRIEALAPDDQPLRAFQVGEEDTAPIRRERKLSGPERDRAAVVRIEAARAPDDAFTAHEDIAAGTVPPQRELSTEATARSAAVLRQPAARQPHDLAVTGQPKCT